MAQKTFELQIVTVTKALFEGDATELHCKSTAGAMVVLAHHEPLITRIEKSVMKVKTADEKIKEFPIESGVLEVANNKAVVLCSVSDE